MSLKRKSTTLDIGLSLSKLMVPVDLLEFFEIFDVKDLSQEWNIILHEKQDQLPHAIKEVEEVEEVVLDGFCNQITVLSHCFSLKPIYLQIHRRRWKKSGEDKHYSNQYAITEDGSKLTPAMAGFLKI